MPIRVKDQQGNEFDFNPVELVSSLKEAGQIEGELKDITPDGEVILERNKFGAPEGLGIPQEKEDVSAPLAGVLQQMGLEQVGVEGEAINTPETAIARSPLTFQERSAMGLLRSEADELKGFLSALGADSKVLDKALAAGKSRDPLIKAFLETRFDEAKKIGDEWKVRQGNKWIVANGEGLDGGDFAEFMGIGGSNALAGMVGAIVGAKTGAAIGTASPVPGAGPVLGTVGALAGGVGGALGGEVFEQEIEKRLVNSLKLGSLSEEELNADRAAEGIMATAGEFLGPLSVAGAQSLKTGVAVAQKAGSKAMLGISRMLQKSGAGAQGRRSYARYLSFLNRDLNPESIEAILSKPTNALKAGRLVDQDLARPNSKGSVIREAMTTRINQELGVLDREAKRLFGEAESGLKAAINRGELDSMVDGQRIKAYTLNTDDYIRKMDKVFDDVRPFISSPADDRVVDRAQKAIRSFVANTQERVNRRLGGRLVEVNRQEGFNVLKQSLDEVDRILKSQNAYKSFSRSKNPQAVNRLFTVRRALKQAIVSPTKASASSQAGIVSPLGVKAGSRYQEALAFYSQNIDSIAALAKFRDPAKAPGFAQSVLKEAGKGSEADRAFALKELYTKSADNLNKFAGHRVLNPERFFEDLGIMDGALAMRDVVPSLSNQATMLRFNTPIAGAVAVTAALTANPALIAASASTIPAVFPRVGLRGFQKAARINIGLRRTASRRPLSREAAEAIALRTLKAARLNATFAALPRGGVETILRNPAEFDERIGQALQAVEEPADVEGVTRAAVRASQRGGR